MVLVFLKRGVNVAKIILMPNSQKQIEKTIDLVDGYILGIKSLSINASFLVKENIKIENKKIFVLLNKNYQNRELKKIEKTINQLKPIDGILFADLALLKLNKKIKLYWHAEHFTTHYQIIDDASGMFVSNDLNIKEMVEIRKKTKKELFVQVFGHYPIFNSVRHLVNNFCETEKKSFLINHENDFFPIIDDQNGTTIYSSKLINGIDYIEKLKDFDYWVINGFNIGDKELLKVINNFKNKTKFSIKNQDNNFFEKKVIYKLKEQKNEKN